MGNCKDCRFFDGIWCDKVEWGEDKELPKEKEAMLFAYASDDSGLRCGLKVGPMFGCVLFQQCGA